MKKLPMWAVASLVAAVAILIIVAVNVVQILAKPGASEQMRLAVNEMKEATLTGKPGGFLEHMSRSLKLPPPYDAMVSNPHAELSRWIRQAEIERLEVTDVKPEVYGTSGVVHANVDLVVSSPFTFSYNGPVEINFRKEVHKRLFVIPEEKWLVESFGPVDPSSIQYGF